MKEAYAMIIIIVCIFGIACLGIWKIGEPVKRGAAPTPSPEIIHLENDDKSLNYYASSLKYFHFRNPDCKNFEIKCVH